MSTWASGPENTTVSPWDVLLCICKPFGVMLVSFTQFAGVSSHGLWSFSHVIFGDVRLPCFPSLLFKCLFLEPLWFLCWFKRSDRWVSSVNLRRTDIWPVCLHQHATELEDTQEAWGSMTDMDMELVGLLGLKESRRYNMFGVHRSLLHEQKIDVHHLYTCGRAEAFRLNLCSEKSVFAQWEESHHWQWPTFDYKNCGSVSSAVAYHKNV